MPDGPARDVTFDFRRQGEAARTLRYDYAALEWIDAATGGQMIQILNAAQTGRPLSPTHLRIFLQAALRHAEPAITAATVRDRIEHYVEQDGAYLSDLYAAVGEACAQCKLLQMRPDPEDDADPDPPAPADAGRPSPGPTTSARRSASPGGTSRSRARRSGR